MSVLSIVIPCYNEEQVIDLLYSSLLPELEKFEGTYEIIFVNDGSKDRTEEKLATLAEKNDRVKVINFSRNFGHQIAITAGIEHSRGDAVIVMDADLQDPPELIHAMVGKWREGYDVVYAVREHRHGESWFKLVTAKLFYRLLSRLTSFHVPPDTGDFRLLSRRAVGTFTALRERNRFVRGLVSWIGFRQCGIPFVRPERAAGSTKYPLRKMFRFAMDGFASFSALPLKIAMFAGILMCIASFFGILWVLYLKFFAKTSIQGWASIMVAIFLFNGMQFIFIGLLGEYIGRIYDEVKQRPLYVIESSQNIEKISE